MEGVEDRLNLRDIMKAQKVIGCLRLANRLDVLNLLIDKEGLTNKEIFIKLRIAQPYASQAVSDLLWIGIVNQERKGKEFRHYINYEQYEEYKELIAQLTRLGRKNGNT